MYVYRYMYRYLLLRHVAPTRVEVHELAVPHRVAPVNYVCVTDKGYGKGGGKG